MNNHWARRFDSGFDSMDVDFSFWDSLSFYVILKKKYLQIY